MIIMRISNGLGNQMFQYAFGRQLQEIYHMPLILETYRYGRMETYRKLRLENLNIKVSKEKADAQHCYFVRGVGNLSAFMISLLKRHWAERIQRIPQNGAEGYAKMIKRGMYVTRDIISYYPFEKTNAKTIIAHGWFMSEKYFHDIAPIIKEELRVKDECISNDEVRHLADKMLLENSVCIHIRRGDYIGHPRFDVCTEAYYRRAVEKVKELVDEPVLYVFSNNRREVKWLQEHYLFLSDAHFVYEGKTELDDLYLMYHCRHHVISNSTFGWWGSYLKLQEGITICPERWMNEEMQQDILLDDWIRLPV